MAHGAPKTKAEAQPVLWGVLAEFKSPKALTHACEAVRDAGYAKWDAYAPFPVHGLNEAMGLKFSSVSRIVGVGAILGFSGAMLLQWWTGAIDYQIVVGGKPLSAWEPWIPVTFEMSILFAAFGAVFGMLALNGLPRWHHPLFTSERFLSVSDDAFFIAIEANDPAFQDERVRELLANAGGYNIEAVYDE
ncbi:MAG: DUF3341 domain-containing protein [Phycisphaerales bacterium]|nr:MAG: DUF3341 domain-containing protein [Phycisphaerales bacterium]